ncbi:MAG: TolB family protein [Myxococcales bacterium]
MPDGGTGGTSGPGLVDCPTTPSSSIFEDGGFGANWFLGTDPAVYAYDKILYNKRSPDGHYNVFVVNADGSDDHSITYENPLLPGYNAGCANWSPSGNYIVFAAENSMGKDAGADSSAICGLGIYQDLWAILPDGGAAWQLTEGATNQAGGTMIPRFARDGRVVWTQMTARAQGLGAQVLGYWDLKIAQFEETGGGPRLTGVQTLQPAGSEPQAFYESGDFSPDGNSYVFTSSYLSGKPAYANQIFRLDFDGGTVTPLTSSQYYSEHPRYTPDGKTIVWMANYQNAKGGDDWWLMNADGSNQRRLSSFNDPSSPEYRSGMVVITGSVAWDPTGTFFVGDAQYGATLLEALTAPSAGREWELKVTCP